MTRSAAAGLTATVTTLTLGAVLACRDAHALAPGGSHRVVDSASVPFEEVTHGAPPFVHTVRVAFRHTSNGGIVDTMKALDRLGMRSSGFRFGVRVVRGNQVVAEHVASVGEPSGVVSVSFASVSGGRYELRVGLFRPDGSLVGLGVGWEFDVTMLSSGAAAGAWAPRVNFTPDRGVAARPGAAGGQRFAFEARGLSPGATATIRCKSPSQRSVPTKAVVADTSGRASGVYNETFMVFEGTYSCTVQDHKNPRPGSSTTLVATAPPTQPPSAPPTSSTSSPSSPSPRVDASLPSHINRKARAFFGGSASAPVGLASLEMRVAGRRVFTRTLSGAKAALGQFYFDARESYAGRPGRYGVELVVRDAKGRSASWTSVVTVTPLPGHTAGERRTWRQRSQTPDDP